MTIFLQTNVLKCLPLILFAATYQSGCTRQVNAQASPLLTTPAGREVEQQLQNMSEHELEQLCIERGFELIKDEIDEETGQPVVSTHQDYVDAAWQCLQMEDMVAYDLYNMHREPGKDQKGWGQRSPPPADQQVSLEAHDEGALARYEDFKKTLDTLLPLPKPVKNFLGRLLIRLVDDGIQLLNFIRRQLDAILGLVKEGITGQSFELLVEKKSKQQQATATKSQESHEL